MSIYSYKNQEPATLPFRIRLDDGSTRTSLNELSAEELEPLGYVGPIVKPEFDVNTQRIEWTGSSYEITEFTEEEIAQKVAEKEAEEHRKKIENIDYNRFWELLITSGVYKKLRTAASQSLVANTLCTELIALFGDAKAGKPNVGIIQQYMNIIFFNFEFTPKEVEELQGFMNATNLSVQYTLPDAEYLSSHTYDPESNTIVSPAPFASWVLVNGKWEAPVSYPTDGKVYNWNEDQVNWVEI
jgi:hypothetical protein